MTCNKCGSQNPDNALSCASCGEILPQQAPSFSTIQPSEDFQQSVPMRPNIPNYLVQSILLIVFSVICCFTCFSLVALPFAIIAVVNASKVNSALARGDVFGAEQGSKNAKKWCWVALWVLIGGIVLGILMNIALAEPLRIYFEDLLKQIEQQNPDQFQQ